MDDSPRSLDRLAAVLWIASTMMALYVCYDLVRDAPEMVALRAKALAAVKRWRDEQRQRITERRDVGFMFWQARDALMNGEADDARSED